MASVIVIRINGVDVTDDVIYSDAEFNSQASGSPGNCKFRLKDINYAYELVIGQSITLDIDGVRMWGGFVQSVYRQFFFPYTGSPLPEKRVVGPHGDPCLDAPETSAMVVRAIVVEGTDYNILLRKRFCFDKSRPARAELKSWPAGTHDDVQIRYLCANNLDLAGDGIDYTTKVEYVGSPNPDSRGNPAGAGWSWDNAMRAIARYPGALYYIDPDKFLVYTDVDTPNATHKLRDVPSAEDELGYREMEILYNGANLVNDAMVWGAGQGAKRVRFRRTRDTTSISDHNLWQVGDFRGDLWRQASVDKRSNSFVYGSPQNKRGGKDDAISVTCTLFKPVFKVSQKVDFRSDVYGYADVLPIRRMKITFPTTKEARFDIVLSHYIDEPWNTFEYWFPPIKIPQIVIPDTYVDELCPVGNYPREIVTEDLPGGPGGTRIYLGPFDPVFGDDFDRSSGELPDESGGWWERPIGTKAEPDINADHTLTLDSTGYTVRLVNPISASTQVICAVDLSSWSDIYGGTLYVGGAGQRIFSLSANGDCLCATSLYYTKVPKSLLRGKVYIRAVLWRGYYSAIKIWPQAVREPFDWTATSDMGVDDMRVLYDVTFSGTNMPKLRGLSIWADHDTRPAKIGLGGPGTNAAGSWYKSWDTPAPDDGPYAVAWGTESSSDNAGDIGQDVNAAWWYWDPKSTPNNGAINAASASVRSYHLDNKSYPGRIATPNNIKISGTMTVSFGQSGGLMAGRIPQLRNIYGIVTLVPQGWSVNSQPYWLGEGYYRAMGGTVWGGLFTCASPGGWVDIGDSVSIDFETNSLGSYDIDPYGHHLNTMTIGCAIWDPVSLLRSLDPSNGPFMLPNTAHCSASISNLSISAYYPVYPTGKHFCVPDGEAGALEDSRVCEDIPLDVAVVTQAIQTGENWSIILKSPYKPGTVTVTVDGVETKAAIDFIESAPSVGIIRFMNSFLYAKELRVCYVPEDGGNDEVDTIPYGEIQVPI